MRTIESTPGVTAPTDTVGLPATAPRPSVGSQLVRWVPFAVVALVAARSLLSSGVSARDLLIVVTYWVVTLVVPGTLVFRALRGRSLFLAEDLAIGAVTGLAMEILSWYVLRAVGLDGLVRWWWLAVLVLFVATPTLRQHWTDRCDRPLPAGSAWSMAALTSLVLIAVDNGGFSLAAVPPAASSLPVDMWWHLSIIHELMRPGAVQIPQVVGESLNYHFNSHVHMSVASATTGIGPEVMLLRLYPVFSVIVFLGAIAAVTRQLSGRVWGGPLAAWLATGALAGGYIWLGVPITAASPIQYLSPSQLLANSFIVVGAAALIAVLRGRLGPTGWVWALLIIAAGAGAKPTVLPMLLAGTGLACLSLLVTSRRVPRGPAGAFGALIVLMAVTLARTGGRAGSSITVLGSIKTNTIYRNLTGDTTLRAVNDGLILDSLDDRAALAAAAATLIVLFGAQAIRLVGFAAVLRRDMRRDPVTWWFIGAISSAFAAFLLFDQAGFGQAYFLHTAVPLGAILTVWCLARSLADAPRSIAIRGVLIGVAIGAVLSIATRAMTRASARAPGFGLLERVALPLIGVACVVVVGVVVWRRMSHSLSLSGVGMAVVISVSIGATVPASLDIAAFRVGDWLRVPTPAVDPATAGFVSAAEADAAVWLRSNSDDEDVIVTNLHCRPPSNSPEFCDARGFWLSGMAGRRVVVEGWAYTAESLAAHGDGGRPYATQPPPWPDRFELSQRAVTDPTSDVLDALVREYSVDWVVGVRRAGPVSPPLDDLTELAFDNGEVAIYRVVSDG